MAKKKKKVDLDKLTRLPYDTTVLSNLALERAGISKDKAPVTSSNRNAFYQDILKASGKTSASSSTSKHVEGVGNAIDRRGRNLTKAEKEKFKAAHALSGTRVIESNDKALHVDRGNSELPIPGTGRPFKKSEQDMLNAELQARVAEADRKMAQLSEGVVASQSTVGQELLNQEIAKSEFLNKYEKKLESENIKDPQILTDKVLSNQKRREEGKKPSIKDSFMESLTFFLPNIVGMAVGGLIEGAEGAVAGEKKAGELAGAFRDYKFKREELEAKKLKESKEKKSALKLDVTPDFQTRDTKEALFTKQKADGNVGFFKVGTGEEVSSSNAEKIQEASMAAREDRLTSQSGRNFTQKQAEEGNKYVRDFRKNYKADIDQMNQMKVAKDLIDGKQLSPDQLATFNAKVIFQEARITDEDVIRAKIPQNLLQRMLNAPKSFLSGKLTPDERKAANKLLNVIMNRKRKILEEAAARSVTPLKLKATGLTKDDLLFEFRSAIGLDTVKSKKVYTDEEIDKMSKEELKAYLGEK